MSSSLGMVEVLIACVVGLFGLGIPAAILVLLYMIYNKLMALEQLLKNKE